MKHRIAASLLGTLFCTKLARRILKAHPKLVNLPDKTRDALLALATLVIHLARTVRDSGATERETC